MPAGAFVIGAMHKFCQLNMFLKGKLLVPDGNGEFIEISAPMTYTATAGQKVGYILEDVVWLDIHATDETDIPTLEDMLIDIPVQVKQIQKKKTLKQLIEPKKNEYFPLTPEATKEFEFTDFVNPSCRPMPYGTYKFARGNKAVGEVGIFCTSD
jgi:hypothetical protein